MRRLHLLFNDLENRAGWREFAHRLAVMREDLKKQLYFGALDKFGNSHDNEKRAVLLYLDTVLGVTSGVHKLYDELTAKKEELEAKSGKREGGIHGIDLPEWMKDDSMF